MDLKRNHVLCLFCITKLVCGSRDTVKQAEEEPGQGGLEPEIYTNISTAKKKTLRSNYVIFVQCKHGRDQG